jgi:hypothetical protein
MLDFVVGWEVACCRLTHTGAIPPGPNWKVAVAAALANARFALPSALPVLPTYYDCHRAPALWPLPGYCRLSKDLLLFAFDRSNDQR